MDYMINRQDKLTDLWDSSLDPLVTNGFQGSSNNTHWDSSNHVVDESLMILHSSGSLDQVASDGRTAMDMDNELPSVLEKAENHAVGPKSQGTYEPNDLNLMPDRVMEDGQSGYDPALDYEMQAQVKDAAELSGKEEVPTDAKRGPKMVVKDHKLKADKRIKAGVRKEKPSKLNPSEDAQARTEKLRAFKADLQKLKKEKEEEQIKRLEALKMERQKRIVARNGANPAQSPLPSQQATKQMPKLSPVSQKGSKFSDTDPGSSSPLQRSTLRTVSKVSADSNKASKPGRLTSGAHVSGNRLTRSASPVSVQKEENYGPKPDPNTKMARIRRLSEPKSSGHQISSGKTQSAEAVSRRRASEGSVIKKMPASANLDKTESAAPPELKLRASKGSSVSAQKKSTTKEMLQKPNEKMLSNAPTSANLTKGNVNISSLSDEEDNTIVEKTVVILECEKPSVPILHASEDKTSVQNMQSFASYADCKSEDYLAIPPPASLIALKEVDREPSDAEVRGRSYTRLNETGAAYTEKVLPKRRNDGTTEKPYQAPYARVSSLEDLCMANSDYGKAPPTSLEMATTLLETAPVHVPDIQRKDLVQLSEAVLGKHHQGKESSKGFKRWLKFGKKNSIASESKIEPDKDSHGGMVVGDSAFNGSSSEVFTLKNLLSLEVDERSGAGTTPKKSS